jgi:hypothetical protein
MTKPHRQRYGLGSFIKKFTKPIKKVLKSPLAKAALLGGLGYYGLGKLGGVGNIPGWSKFVQPAWKAFRGLSGGKQALLGAGVLGVGMPYIQKLMKTGPYAKIEEDDEDWTIQSTNLANLLAKTKDYYRNYDPYSSDLSFQPAKPFVDPTFYSAKGGLASLANGGGVAEAKAEQMLKMEYQKYRNQGGTMSYQRFKMMVLQQAQQQGPMAQGQPQMAQPQMAAEGGRIGLANGGVPSSHVPGYTTPAGYNKFDYPTGGVRVGAQAGGRIGYADPAGLVDYDLDLLRSNLPNLDEVEMDTPWLTKKTEEEAKAAQIKSIWALLQARGLPPKKKIEYIKKKTQNKAEGGLMNLGGMEKDYRQEGGFVPLGKKEKADDVPARLSKNEFVFTADAVRNAGGGDIDAGAEVMENVMNNLEAGGEISEESQGAQGMYDQQQMLQSRMA